VSSKLLPPLNRILLGGKRTKVCFWPELCVGLQWGSYNTPPSLYRGPLVAGRGIERGEEGAKGSQ